MSNEPLIIMDEMFPTRRDNRHFQYFIESIIYNHGQVAGGFLGIMSAACPRLEFSRNHFDGSMQTEGCVLLFNSTITITSVPLAAMETFFYFQRQGGDVISLKSLGWLPLVFFFFT